MPAPGRLRSAERDHRRKAWSRWKRPPRGWRSAARRADTGEPLIDSERQRDLISRALAALGRLRDARAGGVTADLLAVDLADALDALGEITGEVTTAEILERMFAGFCVGK